MSRSKFFAKSHIIRQRQITCSRDNSIASHNNSSIVKRCIMLKDINQHLTGHQTIQFDPRILVLCKHNFLLYYNQCSGLHLSHLITCCHKCINCFIIKSSRLLTSLKWNNRSPEIFLSQSLQRSPKLRLKHNNRSCRQNTDRIRRNP